MGIFTVKVAYKALSNGASDHQSKNLNSPSFGTLRHRIRQKTTAWRIMDGRLATCDNLLKRQVSVPITETVCALCKLQLEDTNHLFFSCQKTTEIWYEVLLWLGKQLALPSNAKDHLFNLHKSWVQERRKISFRSSDLCCMGASGMEGMIADLTKEVG
ncbi:uncharacterized protein LOC131010054 [Salvia miltiorrhiza]|uniref:uncharacterized protein LOC131010054 n=1 Tax=Salvia miltiorrhiza TaxID=226208 RepID=UPI0025ACE1A6|nr:uncharacterized protein LOC131010054 [Salvia miltiorrhiza]